jgi:hypothetical protein
MGFLMELNNRDPLSASDRVRPAVHMI